MPKFIDNDSITINVSNFGVISNVYATFREVSLAMILSGALGPYDVKLSPTNFIHMHAMYTDGSGDSAISRIFKRLPLIATIEVDAELLDTVVLVINRGTNDAIRVYNRDWYGVPCAFCGAVIRAGETCPNCGGH
ncbi:MAG: hypothetical protein H8D74_00945 [Chloroflexi bacterium]|nr:hypothetical protein [Chloroflexota bacterium]